MIIFKITGGLGNQLFKISKALEYKNKYNLVFLDTNFYINDKYNRKFHFNNFNKIKIIIGKKRVLIFKYKKFLEKVGLFTTYSEEDLKNNNLSKFRINLIHGNFEENAEPPDNVVSLFKEYFEIDKLNVKQSNFVAVHFRRLNYDMKLDIEYYQKAIQYFQELDEDFIFHFYSDDINFLNKELKGNFENIEFEIKNINDTIDAFKEISTYQNYIMSNSTFSWWAIYINKKTNKNVIYPIIWFPKRKYEIINLNSWIGL